MGLIQIVDDQDNLIGHVERSDINYDTQRYRISAVWLRNSQGQALIAKRSAQKDKDPGKWGPAAVGTIDKDETYDTNIRKELAEEIGITGIELKKGPRTQIDEPRMYFCQWYYGVSDLTADEFTLQQEEVEEVKWVDEDWLRNDMVNHPEIYVPAMTSTLDLIVGTQPQ